MHSCDMVNIDWGLDEEDEIYQVPDVTFRNPNGNSDIVRSHPVSTINPQRSESQDAIPMKLS